MNMFWKMPLNAVIVWLVAVAIVLLVGQVAPQLPSAIDVADGTAIVTLHAEGAQIYQCKPDSDGKSPSQKSALTWQFREPIATLILDGQSFFFQYAGPPRDSTLFPGAKAYV